MVVHEPLENTRSRATRARSGPHQKSLWYSEGQAALSLWLCSVFDQELGSIIIKLWSNDMGGTRTHCPVLGCSVGNEMEFAQVVGVVYLHVEPSHSTEVCVFQSIGRQCL